MAVVTAGALDSGVVAVVRRARGDSKSPRNSWIGALVVWRSSPVWQRRVAAQSRQSSRRLTGSRRRHERHCPGWLRAAKSRQARHRAGVPAMLDAQARQSTQLSTFQPVWAQAAQRPRGHNRLTRRPQPVHMPGCARACCLHGVQTPAQQRRVFPQRVQATTSVFSSR